MNPARMIEALRKGVDLQALRRLWPRAAVPPFCLGDVDRRDQCGFRFRKRRMRAVATVCRHRCGSLRGGGQATRSDRSEQNDPWNTKNERNSARIHDRGPQQNVANWIYYDTRAFRIIPYRPADGRLDDRTNTQPSKYVLGRRDEAMREAALFIATTPNFTIAHWSAAQPARDMETVQRLAEGYRMAGLPE